MKVTLSTSGGTMNLSGTVTITATATPAVQVTRVEIFVDDVLVATDTSAPFTHSWSTLSVPDGNHQLKARAFYPRNKVSEVKLDVSVRNIPLPPPPPPVDAVPVNTVVPVITGTATEGRTLTVSGGEWTNSPTSFTSQWIRCDAAGANCVVIPSATGTTYTLVAADVGATIRCAVTAFNAAGASAQVQTAQTAVVSALAPAVPTNITLPTIAGTPTHGNTLSVSNGSWTNSPTSYTRQWQRCNSSGASCVSITGATAATYALVATDVGSTIRCLVTAINASGSSTPAQTAATAVVAPIPPPPPGSGEPPAIAGQGYSIVFQDQFTTLDVGFANTWSMGIWYSDPHPDSRHIYLENGRLQLRSIRNVAPHYPSVTTLHHTGIGGRAWKFGYFEAYMRWDAVSGAWPAFWLLSKLDRYGLNVPDTPQQWCSELDIFEGYMDSYYGPTAYTGTLHKNTGSRWGITDEIRKAAGGGDFVTVANMTTGFHKYAALWTATEVAWFFDDVELNRVAAFDSTAQDMFLILGMQYSNHVPMGADTMNLEVDWVKVWQK